MSTAASVEMPASTASQIRQWWTLNSGVHGDRNVTYAPNAEASIPITPLAKSSVGCATRTSSNFCGNARLTRKMSAKSRTIEMHQMTVTAAWNSQYAFWLLSLATHGLKIAITNSDARTVCARIAFTGTLRSFTFASAVGIRCSSPETKSKRLNE